MRSRIKLRFTSGKTDKNASLRCISGCKSAWNARRLKREEWRVEHAAGRLRREDVRGDGWEMVGGGGERGGVMNTHVTKPWRLIIDATVTVASQIL